MEELKRTPDRARAARVPDRARAARAIADFLQALGLDPQRDPELSQAPRLVTQAFADDLLSGYAMDPKEILAGAVTAPVDSGVVAVRALETTLMCPHHLMPASGVTHLAYAPGERTVGLGALARLVECFSRRLILQETFVERVAQTLCDELDARGAACVAVLSQSCLSARGERRHGAQVVSFASAGAMRPGEPLHASALSLLSAPAVNAP